MNTFVRWLIRRDMPNVLEISAAGSDPRTETELVKLLRNRNCIGLVAEAEDDGQRAVAFIIYSLHKNNLHIETMAVHPELRRRGLGTAMIDKLKGKLSDQRRTAIDIEISEADLPTQQFLRARQFRCEHLQRGGWMDGRDRLEFRFSSLKRSAALIKPRQTTGL